jgi:hypothetical protein
VGEASNLESCALGIGRCAVAGLHSARAGHVSWRLAEAHLAAGQKQAAATVLPGQRRELATRAGIPLGVRVAAAGASPAADVSAACGLTGRELAVLQPGRSGAERSAPGWTGAQERQRPHDQHLGQRGVASRVLAVLAEPAGLMRDGSAKACPGEN